MQEQLPPKPEDYPIGKILKKTREFLGISAQKYQNKLQKKAEKMGYGHLNLFKDGDRNSYSEPERKAFISKRKERLEVICEVLQLPADLFMRHNECPVLGFALNSVISKGEKARLFCQTSMFPSDPRQMYSSEHSASPHIIEAMAHFVLQTQGGGGVTFVSRRSSFIGAIVVSATLLLAERTFSITKGHISRESYITEYSKLIAKHCIGQSGTLDILYRRKDLEAFLRCMTIHVLQDKKGDISRMARRGPVTYWMISNTDNLRGFISLGQRSFLELSDFDTCLLEERFNIASSPKSNSFKQEFPHKNIEELLKHAEKVLHLKFVPIVDS